MGEMGRELVDIEPVDFEIEIEPVNFLKATSRAVFRAEFFSKGAWSAVGVESHEVC